MRDPERIKEIIAKLEAFWWKHPDWRLGQIVGNAAPLKSEIFFMEDDVFLRELEDLDRRGV